MMMSTRRWLSPSIAWPGTAVITVDCSGAPGAPPLSCELLVVLTLKGPFLSRVLLGPFTLGQGSATPGRTGALGQRLKSRISQRVQRHRRSPTPAQIEITARITPTRRAGEQHRVRVFAGVDPQPLSTGR